MQRPCAGNLVGTFKAQQGGRVAEAERERGKREWGTDVRVGRGCFAWSLVGSGEDLGFG